MSEVVMSNTNLPNGVTIENGSALFRIYSSADHVELCLFDSAEDQTESKRIAMNQICNHLWQAEVEGIGPGQLYAFRANGDFAPKQGKRYNSHKILLDPYAKGVTRNEKWHQSLLGYKPQQGLETLNSTDSAADAPLSVVVDESFDWGDDQALRTPWNETIIYECHVKGFSKLNSALPENLRGTYAGLGHEASIQHLRQLGITAVELLPVYAFLDEPHLQAMELNNYWGYNPLTFFAADPRYAIEGTPAHEVIKEFKHMVRNLHRAGIEVLLDVVYNHTAEGDHLGPTLSFKGLANNTYYKLDPKNRQNYFNWSGCGNTWNAHDAKARQMILESLRYWVREMHVDGFRFDLATTLGREKEHFSVSAPLFRAIADDPVLRACKFIAEPWDLGPDGFRLGGFPDGWSEWNAHFKQAIRKFWRGDKHMSSEWARRYCGSQDLFAGRGPQASINYVTSHDGFTLQDLISYKTKHNDANGENNRDGENHNSSWNCGVEGPSENPQVLVKRERYARNLLTSLMISAGVPMLNMGDEVGRTQLGNNNAYCQDNEISWMTWDWSEAERDRFDFVCRLIHAVKNAKIPKPANFFTGKKDSQTGFKDIMWLRTDGAEMQDKDWHHQSANLLNFVITDSETNRLFWILMSADSQTQTVSIPHGRGEGHWEIAWNTDSIGKGSFDSDKKDFQLAANSLTILEWNGNESKNSKER